MKQVEERYISFEASKMGIGSLGAAVFAGSVLNRDVLTAVLRYGILRSTDRAFLVHVVRRAGRFTAANRRFFRTVLRKRRRGQQPYQHHTAEQKT